MAVLFHQIQPSPSVLGGRGLARGGVMWRLEQMAIKALLHCDCIPMMSMEIAVFP